MPDPTHGGEVDILISKVYGTDYQSANYKEITEVGVEYSYDGENWTLNVPGTSDLIGLEYFYTRCWTKYTDDTKGYGKQRRVNLPGSDAQNYKVDKVLWARSKSPLKVSKTDEWVENTPPEWRVGTFLWNKLILEYGQEKVELDPVCCPHALDDSINSNIRAVFGVEKDEDSSYGVMPVIQLRNADNGELLVDIIKEYGGGGGGSGAPGRGITKTVVSYQMSTTGSTIPTGEWSSTPPVVANSRYLWTRIEFVYTDNTNSYAYVVAKSGDKGDKGDDGNGIVSINYEYYQSNERGRLIGGSWVDSVPTRVNGKYIWMRSTITYTDSDPVTTNAICTTGDKGTTGDDGEDGVGISSVSQQYYVSESRITLLGGEWIDTPPLPQDDKYIWVKFIFSFTDGTTNETQPLCTTGQKGAGGEGGGVGSAMEIDVINALWAEVFDEKVEEPEPEPEPETPEEPEDEVEEGE